MTNQPEDTFLTEDYSNESGTTVWDDAAAYLDAVPSETYDRLADSMQAAADAPNPFSDNDLSDEAVSSTMSGWADDLRDAAEHQREQGK